jgi:hypothetical protein
MAIRGKLLADSRNGLITNTASLRNFTAAICAPRPPGRHLADRCKARKNPGPPGKEGARVHHLPKKHCMRPGREGHTGSDGISPTLARTDNSLGAEAFLRPLI